MRKTIAFLWKVLEQFRWNCYKCLFPENEPFVFSGIERKGYHKLGELLDCEGKSRGCVAAAGRLPPSTQVRRRTQTEPQ